ncbi:MAG: hypothetical protein JNM80_03620 [Phycisphaerae bacterium]|nr:hypothetical protein [Phycisphaerae bacterium]
MHTSPSMLRRAALVPVLLASLAAPASAQPLPDRWTVIVHGRTTTDYPTLTSPSATGSNWMWSVANRIAGMAPGQVNIYRMAIDDFSTLTQINPGGTTPADPTRHHVLLFDWTATSNLIFGTAGLDDGYAYAAGDAVVALLHQFNAASKVQSLIGYSRGAVVISETARRLILAGRDPDQVLYLDGEGSDSATGGLYDDARFVGWLSPRAQQVDFANAYETCTEIPALGGIRLDSARNFSVGTAYSHAGWFTCGDSFYWYAANNLIPGPRAFDFPGPTCASGTFCWSPTPSPAALLDPAIGPNWLPYNGDQQFRSLAGWSSHGGGAGPSGATPVAFAGRSVLRFTTSGWQRHSYFYIPPAASGVLLDAAVAATSAGLSTLNVFIDSPGLPEVQLLDLPPGGIAVQGLSTSLATRGPFGIPAVYQGRVCRLRVELAQQAAPAYTVYVADVRLGSGPACYANCDGSTASPVLNVNDFACFLNAYAAGAGYANCDQSTTAPVLNINDFVCFLNRFAAGCS